MKTTILISFILFFLQAHAQLVPCGDVRFDFKNGCNKGSVQFNVSKCEEGSEGYQKSSTVTCGKEEITATYKGSEKSYRAVFALKGGEWLVKGKVWSFKKKSSSSAAAVVGEDISIRLKPESKKSQLPAPVPAESALGDKSEEMISPSDVTSSALTLPVTAASTHEAGSEAVPEAKKEMATPALATQKESLAEPTSSDWKFKFSGWVTIEQENIKNFGDQVSSVANMFNSLDPNSQYSNMNALSNFGFTAEKETHKFVSLFEVGEVYFGESTTGGTQGLRGKNVETRNLYVEEKLSDNWSALLGLRTISSDPHAFILTDHYAGWTLQRKSGNATSSLWQA